MRNNTRDMIFKIFIFALSMAFFESSIVVYLREIYYPEGFSFPLNRIHEHIAITEFARELASVVMIVSVAVIAFKSFYRRFAGFLFIFAVWDIFYYVFLKLLLGWPPSIFTWDILFLIPVTWTGPVITPIFISILMILLSLIILYFSDRIQGRFKFLLKEKVILVVGAFIVFIAFIWDYTKFLIYNMELANIHHLYKNLEILTLNYVPNYFNWWIFSLGVICILIAIFMIFKRNRLLIHSK